MQLRTSSVGTKLSRYALPGSMLFVMLLGCFPQMATEVEPRPVPGASYLHWEQVASATSPIQIDPKSPETYSFGPVLACVDDRCGHPPILCNTTIFPEFPKVWEGKRTGGFAEPRHLQFYAGSVLFDGVYRRLLPDTIFSGGQTLHRLNTHTAAVNNQSVAVLASTLSASDGDVAIRHVVWLSNSRLFRATCAARVAVSLSLTPFAQDELKAAALDFAAPLR